MGRCPHCKGNILDATAVYIKVKGQEVACCQGYCADKHIEHIAFIAYANTGGPQLDMPLRLKPPRTT